MDIEQDPRGVPSPSRLNYTAYRFSRAMDRFAENLALAHGLTLSQFLVLQVLAEGLPISNAQLARRTFVSAQAAHNVSNELIDAGLVERGDHPTNQRIRLVRLTEQGWSLIRRCYAELQQHENELAARLGDARRGTSSWVHACCVASATRGRTSARHSCSSSTPAAAWRRRPVDPNRSGKCALWRLLRR